MFELRFALLALSTLTLIALLAPHAFGSDRLPDPTRPPASVSSEAPVDPQQQNTSLDLRAVFFAEGRRVAIINGHRVHESDLVGSARVLEIKRDRVLLQQNGETIELELVGQNVKNPGPSMADTPYESAHPDAGPDAHADEGRPE